MNVRCAFFAAIACGLLNPPAYAGLDRPLGAGRLTLDATGILDSAIGLWGAGQGRESLNGTVLGEASWIPARADANPVSISAYASVLWVEGRGPSDRILGDFLGASNSEAFQSLRLYSWWFEVSGDLWSLRSGALLADEEFTGTKSGASLINSSFGWPAFISGNTLNTGPAYYAAALGARIAWENEDGWSARAGVYDGDSLDSAAGDDHPNRHGTHYALNSEDGAFFMAELGFAPVDSPNRFTTGVWAHSADFADPVSGDLHHGNYGAYVIAERTLRGRTGEPGNIVAHVRYGGAPDDRNAVAWAVDTAVSATGLLPVRTADTVAFGVAHARLSSGLAGGDYERVFELSYTAAVDERLSLQPDVQYIQHIGAASTGAHSWLFLLRLTAAY
ncbi:carbohydrate porin [Rariglobus hedericola]|uniref:Carbohydrate porin n=1 Tax=Rariglobus hedericola TaxID=2597822 RepID=A0A556QS73_9BACT|nr:carbohydrate porin [Rariglobus hedericola]TSJ79494.1 carbohydrate porin [Rariglobus hedericola]